jgi:hypothetical protein
MHPGEADDVTPHVDTRLANAAHGLLREALDNGADDALVQIEARRSRELSMGADGRLDLRQGSESLAAVTSVRGQRRETRLASGFPVGDLARSRPWLTAEEGAELLREVRDGGDPATARALLGARLSDEDIATVSLTADGCERVSIRVTCGISQWATGPGGQHLEGEFAHGADLPAPGRLWSRRQELIECRGAAWRPADGATRLLLRSPLAVQLISAVAGILNGTAVTGSLSVLRDRIGARIGSPAVTLIDDGLPGATSSSRRACCADSCIPGPPRRRAPMSRTARRCSGAWARASTQDLAGSAWRGQPDRTTCEPGSATALRRSRRSARLA